ncbi:MAG: hypothetical protein WDN23_14205 [Edaphobacter sp.]
MADHLETRFKNSWARLNRAVDHASVIAKEWASFGESGFPTVARYDHDSGWFIASISPGTPFGTAKQTALALELGEYAYQLRAALDGLIWDAITFTQGTEPPADANRLEFPIMNGRDRDFKKCAFHKFPFPGKLRDWIESIQPDAAEKSEGDPDRGLRNTLQTIHNLARFDRHRRLRLVAVAVHAVDFKVISEPPCRVTDHEIIETFDLFDGHYEYLRFRASTADGNVPTNARLESNVALEIVFEDIEMYDLGRIGDELKRFGQAVRHVIIRFEEEFRA